MHTTRTSPKAGADAASDDRSPGLEATREHVPLAPVAILLALVTPFVVGCACALLGRIPDPPTRSWEIFAGVAQLLCFFGAPLAVLLLLFTERFDRPDGAERGGPGKRVLGTVVKLWAGVVAGVFAVVGIVLVVAMPFFIVGIYPEPMPVPLRVFLLAFAGPGILVGLYFAVKSLVSKQ